MDSNLEDRSSDLEDFDDLSFLGLDWEYSGSNAVSQIQPFLSRTSILDLPDELLAMISLAYLQLHEGDYMSYRYICIAHICGQWRTVALQCARLWSRIVVTNNADFMGTLLARSRDAPLSVIADAHRTKPAIKLIPLVRHRICELDLMFCGTAYSDMVAQFATPFPNLENICLRRDRWWKFSPSPPITSFLTNCPHLRRIRICDFHLCTDNADKPQYDSVESLEIFVSEYAHPALDLNVLESFPHLRELQLKLSQLSFPEPHTPPIHLPHLERLCLECDPLAMCGILRTLSFPPTTQIRISNFDFDGSLNDLTQLANTLASMLDNMRTRPFISCAINVWTSMRHICLVASREDELTSAMFNDADLAVDLELLGDEPSGPAFDLLRSTCAPLPIGDVRSLILDVDYEYFPPVSRHFSDSDGSDSDSDDAHSGGVDPYEAALNTATAATLASVFRRMVHLDTLTLDSFSLAYILRFLSESPVVTPDDASGSNPTQVIFPSLQHLQLVNVPFAEDDDSESSDNDSNSSDPSPSPSSTQVDLCLSVLDTWKARQTDLAQLVLIRCPGLTRASVDRLRQVVHVNWKDDPQIEG